MIPFGTDNETKSIARAAWPSMDGNTYYRSDLPRLDPEAKEKWVEALLSDEYKDKQGKNMLKTPKGNLCCLGVYCEVAGVPEFTTSGSFRDPDTNDMAFTHEMPTFGDEANQGDRASSVLIPGGYTISYVGDQALESCTPWYQFDGDEDVFICREQGPRNDVTGEAVVADHLQRNVAYSLPNLNDSGAFNFAQIADVIRYFL